MNIDDEETFLDFLLSGGDVLIVPTTFRGDAIPEMRNFSNIGQIGSYHLWNRSISNPPGYRYVSEQGYNCIDFLNSDVINILRSKITREDISMARLHIEDKIIGDDRSLHKKHLSFLKWYSEISTWIRRHGVAVIDGAYVLQGANLLIGAGRIPVGHRM